MYDENRRGNVTDDECDWLDERFEGLRRRLEAVAYRMLGSRSEAEDAVPKPGFGSVDKARVGSKGSNGGS
jgi:hypothetical protein